MNKDEAIRLAERVKDEGRSLLDGIIRQGAQKILQAALELEVQEHLEAMGVGPDGRRMAVRNGRLPSREIMTGAGALAVEVPRVRHRGQGQWSSAILPKYLRKAPSVEALIPLLYLHGVSTGQMAEALKAKGVSHGLLIFPTSVAAFPASPRSLVAAPAPAGSAGSKTNDPLAPSRDTLPPETQCEPASAWVVSQRVIRKMSINHD
jgi:hypothetical protein